MKADSVESSIQKTIALLASTPPRLRALPKGLTPEQWNTALDPGEWSANAILAHLRACGEVWGGCIAVILAEDAPKFRAVNPRGWIKQTNYLELEFQPSLDAFLQQRAGLLSVLGAIASQDWLRSATVSVAGKPYERSVLFYADWLARHERSHVKQIEKIAKTISG